MVGAQHVTLQAVHNPDSEIKGAPSAKGACCRRQAAQLQKNAGGAQRDTRTGRPVPPFGYCLTWNYSIIRTASVQSFLLDFWSTAYSNQHQLRPWLRQSRKQHHQARAFRLSPSRSLLTRHSTCAAFRRPRSRRRTYVRHSTCSSRLTGQSSMSSRSRHKA